MSALFAKMKLKDWWQYHALLTNEFCNINKQILLHMPSSSEFFVFILLMMKSRLLYWHTVTYGNILLYMPDNSWLYLDMIFLWNGI